MTITFRDMVLSCRSIEEFLEGFQSAFSPSNATLLDAHQTILTTCFQHPDLVPTIKGEDKVKIWMRSPSSG
jgi:hypothetical protein